MTIYVYLIEVKGKPIYAGQTMHLAQRLSAHKRRFGAKATMRVVTVCSGRAQASREELKLIDTIPGLANESRKPCSENVGRKKVYADGRVLVAFLVAPDLRDAIDASRGPVSRQGWLQEAVVRMLASEQGYRGARAP